MSCMVRWLLIASVSFACFIIGYNFAISRVFEFDPPQDAVVLPFGFKSGISKCDFVNELYADKKGFKHLTCVEFSSTRFKVAVERWRVVDLESEYGICSPEFLFLQDKLAGVVFRPLLSQEELSECLQKYRAIANCLCVDRGAGVWVWDSRYWQAYKRLLFYYL